MSFPGKGPVKTPRGESFRERLARERTEGMPGDTSSILPEKPAFLENRPRFHRREKPKEEKPKEDFFGKKGYLSRGELRGKLKKAPADIPGSGKKYLKEERKAMEKEFSPEKYGLYLTKEKFNRRFKELEKQSWQTKNFAEKEEIKRKINYLKKLIGDKN